MGFRLLDHTADVRLEVWGSTLEELFCEAARALFSVITVLETVSPRELRRVEVTGISQEELLVQWLNELLFYHDTEGMLFSDFSILELTPTALRGEARGESFSHDRHEILVPVKSVTYHALEIEERAEGFRCEIILDV